LIPHTQLSNFNFGTNKSFDPKTIKIKRSIQNTFGIKIKFNEIKLDKKEHYWFLFFCKRKKSYGSRNKITMLRKTKQKVEYRESANKIKHTYEWMQKSGTLFALIVYI
jgi:hypothetical protein